MAGTKCVGSAGTSRVFVVLPACEVDCSVTVAPTEGVVVGVNLGLEVVNAMPRAAIAGTAVPDIVPNCEGDGAGCTEAFELTADIPLPPGKRLTARFAVVTFCALNICPTLAVRFAGGIPVVGDDDRKSSPLTILLFISVFINFLNTVLKDQSTAAPLPRKTNQA